MSFTLAHTASSDNAVDDVCWRRAVGEMLVAHGCHVLHHLSTVISQCYIKDGTGHPVLVLI